MGVPIWFAILCWIWLIALCIYGWVGLHGNWKNPHHWPVDRRRKPKETPSAPAEKPSDR